jgi:hypothetical protein
VGITLFLPIGQPTAAVRLLQQIGSRVHTFSAIASLQEHGFCRVTFDRTRVDVFLPSLPFLEPDRRVMVPMGDRIVPVWNPEVVAVLKMLFFRRQDLLDLEDVLKVQGRKLDRDWVRSQLVETCGAHDPRVVEWDRLTAQTPPSADS